MIIETERLSKNYGAAVALKDVTLRIEPGVIGLLGPNGAGKTTLVEILEGLRKASSGRVSVLGLDPGRGSRVLKERIGVQLQATALPEDLTPFETLRLFAAFFRKSLRPADVLERVGLSAKANSRNHTLSGGQRQKLAIGLALINDPDLIILDEPTSGLDPIAREDIRKQIFLLRELRKTVLLTTHYVADLQKVCDRVLFLRGGQVVADELVAEGRDLEQMYFDLMGATEDA